MSQGLVTSATSINDIMKTCVIAVTKSQLGLSLIIRVTKTNTFSKTCMLEKKKTEQPVVKTHCRSFFLLCGFYYNV